MMIKNVGGEAMRTTIYDVATALKLSPGTISKILNNTGTVSQETRDRVLQYVKEIGYVADTNARILKSKFSYTVGVIFSDISLVGLEHPFFGSIIQHFKNYVEKAGYEVVFITSKVGDHELTYLEWCRNKKVDGVFIVSGNINNTYIQELVQSELPCVSSDIIMPGLHSVLSNDYEGIQLGFEYALGMGMKRIAMLSGPQTSRAFYQRQNAYFELLGKYHLEQRVEWVKEAVGFGYTSAYQSTRAWVDEWTLAPDIILAQSDDLAFGVIRALEENGFQVPKDISVIGFDDINFARLFTPSLTTIRQDKEAIGKGAAKLLLQYIQQHESIKTTTVTHVPVEIVIRDSTRKFHE
jgi:DNA-binding LacI/PurR family transcriptional regulator